jgi:hypothetical protein
MNAISLPYASLSYEDPIVIITFHPDVELGFIEIRELIHQAEKISGQKPYFVLSKAPANVRVSPIGKEIAADEDEAPLNKGSAIVVKNKFYQMAANFFQNLKKPKYPYKAFTDEEVAREWLMNLPSPSTIDPKDN